MLESKNEKKNAGRKATLRLKVANAIKLNPENPIPIQYGGNSFAVVFNKKYIPFLGRDNNLPNLLLEARLTSPTQSNCISSIAASVVGNGLYVMEMDPKQVDPDLIEWMKCVNREGESLDDILYGVADGEREQGNQFLEIVKGTVAGKPWMKVYLHPFQYCRFAELQNNETEPSAVVICKLFAKRGYRIKLDEARSVPLWSPNPLDQKKCWVKDDDGNYRTMLHIRNKVSGIDYYGMPASISGLRWQVLEGKGAQYNIDNFDNNMILGGMLALKSAMTEEEAEKTADDILMSHTGAGKTGRVAVVSSENGLDDVKFTPYTTKAEGSFIELDKRIEEKIISTNNWDGVLCGISRGGTLGNGSGYVRSVWDTKEATLLNPLRRKINDKIVVPLMKIYADVFNKKEILKYNFWFNSAMPFSFLGDIKPEQFMQINEARDLAGLPPDDTVKGKYLAEMNIRTTNRLQDQNIPPEN